MMNMKLLSVVTPPSIYYGCSDCKTLWEEEFIVEENVTLGEFTAVNMKIVVVAMLGNKDRSRVVISMSSWTSHWIFQSGQDENQIFRSKKVLVGSGKGIITSLGIKAKARPKKYKKSRNAIVNFSMNDL